MFKGIKGFKIKLVKKGMEKEQLILIIKDWVKSDNEIRELQKKLNIHKKQKKNFTNQLMEVMKNNKIDCFDINDGQIQYKKKSSKKPITKKTLLTVLSTFYNGDITKVEELNKYIMDNREEKSTESIIRKSKQIITPILE
jgi:hypothetical protein